MSVKRAGLRNRREVDYGPACSLWPLDFPKNPTNHRLFKCRLPSVQESTGIEMVR